MSLDINRFRSLYPFKSHWLDCGGLRYHYLDEGSGEPLLCVHGNPTWSFMYRELIRVLRHSYRLIAPDHIGCGLSDKPRDADYEYVLERRVADLEALLERLDLHNVTLVLHDWGGMIGLACALRHPHRIARIVLLNTSGFLKPAGKRLPLEIGILRHVPLLREALVYGFNAFARGAARRCCRRPMTPQVRAAFLAPYAKPRDRIATLRFVQDIPLRPGDRSYEMVQWVAENLHTLADLPMLICWGEQDFVFDTLFLTEWRRRFPDAEVHTFADAGHYLLEDEPAGVIEKIAAFLGKHPLPIANPACAGSVL